MRTFLRSAAATVAFVAVGAIALAQFDLVDLVNPFDSETVVRDHAAVLQSLEDLSEYHAATGEYQVVVDIEDRTRFVPGFLKGERTTFLAQGSVDAVVDLGQLGAESVTVADDGRSVTVVLPPATLADPHVDHEASTVLDRDRGLLDRVGSAFSDSPTSDRGLYVEAESRLADAAAGSELRETAERNTTTMLEDLLRTAGFERVRVVFASPADAT
jgi:hypothetical protein